MGLKVTDELLQKEDQLAQFNGTYENGCLTDSETEEQMICVKVVAWLWCKLLALRMSVMGFWTDQI